MLDTHGYTFFSLGQMLTNLEKQASGIAKLSGTDEYEGIKNDFTKLIDSFVQLLDNPQMPYLKSSIVYLKRMRSVCEQKGPNALIDRHMIPILYERISDELGEALFFYIDNTDLFQNQRPFGAEVWTKFQSSRRDIEEAGKCLAFKRGTACVFHLMRVMEVGLKITASKLGIPYAPGWESYIKHINDKVKEKHKDKSIKWKQDEAFFRDVAARLETVKLAWRNPTMHVIQSYTEEEAAEVYQSVKMFMRHLATKLSEESPEPRTT